MYVRYNSYDSEVFVNDIFIAIPFDDFKTKMNIVSDLKNKKKRGYIIKGIEVDEERQCVIYREPNDKVSN